MSIRIEKLDDLIITKVKPYKIHFKCNGKYYFLLEPDSYEGVSLQLYENIIENDIRKSTEYIMGKICIRISDVLPYAHQKKVYKHIDKKVFIKRLTYYGFVDGMYDEQIKYIKEIEERLNKEIKELSDKERQLRTEKDNLLE